MTFTGFGKFSTSDRAARMGVNPRNPSEKVHIPAATVPKFSAGSQLKAAVKGGELSRLSSGRVPSPPRIEGPPPVTAGAAFRIPDDGSILGA